MPRQRDDLKKNQSREPRKGNAKTREQAGRDISAIMRRVRSRDTTPETVFRKALWARGARFRVCRAPLLGKPDVVLAGARLAVFIDGDFWHGGQWRRRELDSLEEQFRQTPRREYWLKKIRRNMERDCSVTASLVANGWRVLRFWESAIRDDLERCVEITLAAARQEASVDRFSVLPEKTFAEFFAGVGLMRLGLERQGWSIRLANDIDEEKLKMYRGHFTDADKHFHLGDIHELSPDQIPTVTLATASFPCNDLSLAGARRGLRAGPHSSAYWGFIQLLERMEERRPPLVLLENVTGFLTSNRGQDFEDALLALNELGYAVDSFILDAARFVPQSRQRLFVVGVADPALAVAEPSAQRFYQSDARPAALADFVFNRPSIRWGLRTLPSPPERTSTLTTILEDLPESAREWWSPERARYLLEQMSPRHREVAEAMIAGGDWSYGTVFRRIRRNKSTAELRTDGIAGCLRTPRGGSGRQILFKAGRGRYFARLLTPRECARLMGADDYQIVVPSNQALFGFGDAVCVPVIEWIARHYLNPLVGELIRGRVLGEDSTAD
jgi:DNA (cytosine-5)-methyltransferase 1